MLGSQPSLQHCSVELRSGSRLGAGQPPMALFGGSKGISVHCTQPEFGAEGNINTDISGVCREQWIKARLRHLYNFSRVLCFLLHKLPSWCVCRGWVGFLRPRQQNSFPLFVPACAGWEGCAGLQRSFHEPRIAALGWNKTAAPRVLEGNAFHSPISLKAISIGMARPLFINPQCR